MRTLLLALTLSSVLPAVASAEDATERVAVTQHARPWTVYGGLGFPGITSVAVGRWASGVEALVEVGTLAPFPALFTGSGQLHVDVVRSSRSAVFVGAAVAALYTWFTGYEGESAPYWNWGAGPKLGIRHTFPTKFRMSLEGGALLGNWSGTCGTSCRIMPLAMARLGWSF